MKEIFVPWHYALRRLVLPVRAGAPHDPFVFAPADDLRPAVEIPEAENGLAQLTIHLREWPSEHMYPPDLAHRLERLPGERKAAERALAPLRPMLQGLDPILEMPAWQAPLPEKGSPPYRRIERLGRALVLRAALDETEDRARAVLLGRRLRRAEDGMSGFYAGSRIERAAGGELAGLGEDRAEAVRSELARRVLPRLGRFGPFDPWPKPTSLHWTDERHAVGWLLGGHPAPYDPGATAEALLALRSLATTGTAVEIRTRAIEIAGAWPNELRATTSGEEMVPMVELRGAKPALQGMSNPYGALQIARWLNWVAPAAEWTERAKKKAEKD